MWRLGFFFHEMAFGLLSIFLPLYIIAVGGSLVHVGILTAVAWLLSIPASFFWGYICDKTRRYKRYILLSFLSSTLCLYLLTFTRDVPLLMAVYVVMSIFHVAHEAPKNVLISELYSREEWEKTFAFYEGFTESGWLIGLLLGFFATMWGVGAVDTLAICSVLNLLAFGVSIFLVADPLIVFERGLVGIERTLDFTHRGISLASKLLDGLSVDMRLKRENVSAFCCGLILFSLATSILFTPMPIFISSIVQNASLPQGFVFAIFVLNSAGGVAGYLLSARRFTGSSGTAGIGKVIALRGTLAFLLIAALNFRAYSVSLATTVLVAMGFVYALFLVRTLSLSMELVPAGKSGLFNVLVGVGGACGSFIGPLVAQTLGFPQVFALSGVVFFLSLVAFKMFA